MKEDVRRIFEDKMQWWLIALQWSGLYLGSAPSDALHMSRRRKWLKRIWLIENSLAVVYLLAYVVTLGYKLQSKPLFTSNWIASFNVFMWCSGVSLWQISIMFGFGRGNLYSWCHEVSVYCDDYGLNEKFLVVLKKIPMNVIRTIIFIIIFTSLGVLLYELVPAIGQCIYILPFKMKFLNVPFAFMLALFHNSITMQIGSITGTCSSLINHELNRVNKEIETSCEEKNASKTKVSSIYNKPSETSTRLEKAIEQHYRICDLIGHLNKCICHHMAAAFLLGLPVSCFALYILITKVKDTVDVAMTILTIVMFLNPLMSNCVQGCYVNQKAHKALDYVWKLSGSRLPESTKWDVSQLTARLTGTSIGYTVYGFFTFTMPTVLSIIGCILTYFIVVIQFKPPEQTDCTSVCNNSLPAWCGTNQTGIV